MLFKCLLIPLLTYTGTSTGIPVMCSWCIYIHNHLYDVEVAVAAQRDTVTSLTQGQEHHTTDQDILILGQEPGLYVCCICYAIKYCLATLQIKVL